MILRKLLSFALFNVLAACNYTYKHIHWPMAATERTNSRYVSRINEITEICVCNDKLVFSVVVVFGIIDNCLLNYTCV